MVYVYIYIFISWLKYIKIIKSAIHTYIYIYKYTWLWNHIIRSELFRDNHRNILGRWFDGNHARFPWKPWWHLLVIRKDLRIKSQWISLEIGRPLNARKSLNMIWKCIMIYIHILIVCVFVLSIAVFHLAIDNPHLKVSIQIMDCPVIIIELQNIPFPVHSTHPINQT